jgi:hypothetical protein
MYIIGIMMPVKTISGMEGREDKENGEWGEFKYDIFNILLELCKCHNVPPPRRTMKNEKKCFVFIMCNGLSYKI